MAKLRIVAGDGVGTEYPLGEETVSLGRRTASTIHIDHAKASRNHAEINFRDGDYYIRDLGSVNGTHINGIRIPHEEKLKPGDEIRVGGTVLRFFSDEQKIPKIHIPGYKLEDLIAQGGMGTVFRGVQVSMDRYVAIKILHERFAKRKDFVQRFVQEARAAGRLNHPNIIGVHDVGKAGNTYYFSMELVSGNDLSQIMGFRDIETPELMEIGAKVCDALAYAHRNGLIHRDIKPENIMIRDDGVVKLADLGIAKTFEADEDTDEEGKRKVLGTPHYMSPEQASAGEVDGRTDLYSLGCTLYHILGERPPFEGETNREVMVKHLRDEPTPLGELAPEAPKPVLDVVARLMAKEPDERYADAEEAMTALMEAAEAKPKAGIPADRPREGKPKKARRKKRAGGTVSTTAVPRRAARKKGMHPAVQASIGFGVLVLLAILASFFLGEDPNAPPPRPGPGDGGGPAADVLFDKAREQERAGREQQALETYLDIVSRFPADADAVFEAEQHIDRLRRQIRAAEEATAAENAWDEFTAWAETRPDRIDEQERRLDALAENYPALADRITAWRERIDAARAAAVVEQRETAWTETKAVAEAAPRTGDFDGAIQALEDYRDRHPGHHEEEIETLLTSVRAAADAAWDEAVAVAERAKEGDHYGDIIAAYRDFAKKNASQRHHRLAERRLTDLLIEMEERMKRSQKAVRNALAESKFLVARARLARAKDAFAGTDYAETIERRGRAIERLFDFHKDIIEQMETGGPHRTDITVEAYENGEKPLLISGADAEGVRVPLEAGSTVETKVHWEKIPPEKTLTLYRRFADPDDKAHQAALEIYTAVFDLDGEDD